MPDCERRNHLVREWHEAVVKFSHSVSQLKACIGDGEFAKQRQETELARLPRRKRAHDPGTTPLRAWMLGAAAIRLPIPPE
jgi:hypothetical protein